MLLSAVAAMAMAGGLHVSEQYSVDLQRYAARPEGRTISLPDWETTAWQGLSARRLDLGGGLEEPLTIQWLGGLDTFQEHLVADGWRATGEANSPREAVAAPLAFARLAQRSGLMAGSTWDGKVLLAHDPANRKACPPGPTKPRGGG